MALFSDIKYIKIFLASADDVKRERDLLEKVLREENELHYKKQGYLFDCVRWEKDSPIDSQPWQKSLNNLIDNCAIFIMVIWKKLGEGTKEEFEYAIRRQHEKGFPHVLIFYNIDPTNEENYQAGGDLDRFMENLRKDHPQVRVFKYKIKANLQDDEKLDFIFKNNISNWFYSVKKEDKLKKLSVIPEKPSIPVERFRGLNKGF